MNKPNYISDSDWQIVNKYAIADPQEPWLIGSIGWHETRWGTIGAGVNGYHLGFGYFPGSSILQKVKGFENQVKYAHEFIARNFIFPVTLKNTTEFAVNHWKSSVPTAWAKSVYNQFVNITKDNNMDIQLTANFKLSEFARNDQLPPEQYLDNIKKVAVELQKLREAIGKPIRINSGWRTIEHNQAIGGAVNSRHLTGEAADVKVSGLSGERIAIFAARYTNFNGFGVGANYCHLDIRPVLTIWAY